MPEQLCNNYRICKLKSPYPEKEKKYEFFYWKNLVLFYNLPDFDLINGKFGNSFLSRINRFFDDLLRHRVY